MLRRFRDAVLSTRCFANNVTVGFQADPQQAADLLFVIDDQDRGFQGSASAHGFASVETAGGLPSGSRIVNAAPPPGRFSALTRPLCAWTNPFTMARPSPVPPAGAVGAR